MTNFSVGPSPIALVGAGVDNEPLTVQNTGAVSIYLSADPGVSTAAFEYKIDAGGDFTWPPGKSLSVCTGPGVIGQISFGGTGNVRVNSGSTNVTGAVTINGSVPISGPVTVSGSVALNAGSTVAIAGPVAIAGTVPISGNVNIAGGTVGLSGPVSISGGVSVTGSTINVGNAIQLAANPVLLYTGVITVGAGAGTYVVPYQLPPTVGRYSSLLIQVLTTASTVLPILGTNYINLVAYCSAGSGAAKSITYNPQWSYVTQSSSPFGSAYNQSLSIPVTGTTLNLAISVIVGAGYAGTTTISVFGSGQIIAAPLYVSDGDGMLGTIPEGGIFYQTASGAVTTLEYFSSKNGIAFVNIINNNTNTSGYITLGYIDSGNLVNYFGLNATGAAVNSGPITQTSFPMRPMYLFFTNTIAGSYNITVVQ